MSARGRRLAAGLLALAALALGCEEPPSLVAGGDPRAGREAIAAFQCGVCHVIPGVRGARGVVGPPLTGLAHRGYLGGRVPNTPENLVRWVRDPAALAPGTAMPAVGLDEQQARDVAAYLTTLR